MKVNSWKRINTETLLVHPRLTVVEDDVVLPDGSVTKYMRWEGKGQGDYVTLIVSREKKLALIKDYSYPHDEWLWQFPEGLLDDGESPEAAAARELTEETGLNVGRWELLGFNYAHHRRSTGRNYVYAGHSASKATKEVAADPEEQGMSVHWFTLEEIKQMVRRGEILQKNTLAALALYLIQAS